MLAFHVPPRSVCARLFAAGGRDCKTRCRYSTSGSTTGCVVGFGCLLDMTACVSRGNAKMCCLCSQGASCAPSSQLHLNHP
eukprot:6483219-Amphidinium_carterae.1